MLYKGLINLDVLVYIIYTERRTCSLTPEATRRMLSVKWLLHHSVYIYTRAKTSVTPLNDTVIKIFNVLMCKDSGFGGLVVSMLASGTLVRGFEPGWSRWIFSGVRIILSMPSFGGEVKESVPCPRFAPCWTHDWRQHCEEDQEMETHV